MYYKTLFLTLQEESKVPRKNNLLKNIPTFKICAVCISNRENKDFIKSAIYLIDCFTKTRVIPPPSAAACRGNVSGTGAHVPTGAQEDKEQRKGKKTFVAVLHCIDQYSSPPET